jgi:hypothetical protein
MSGILNALGLTPRGKHRAGRMKRDGKLPNLSLRRRLSNKPHAGGINYFIRDARPCADECGRMTFHQSENQWFVGDGNGAAHLACAEARAKLRLARRSYGVRRKRAS